MTNYVLLIQSSASVFIPLDQIEEEDLKLCMMLQYTERSLSDERRVPIYSNPWGGYAYENLLSKLSKIPGTIDCHGSDQEDEKTKITKLSSPMTITHVFEIKKGKFKHKSNDYNKYTYDDLDSDDEYDSKKAPPFLYHFVDCEEETINNLCRYLSKDERKFFRKYINYHLSLLKKYHIEK